MKIKANCPYCGKINYQFVGKKELKKSMKLPCTRCRKGTFSSEWKERGEEVAQV